MRALVTGGTGFVGRHLVQRLCARGDTVRVMVRGASLPKAEDLRAMGAEIVQGDLLDPPSISLAAEGCEVVFHVAALVGAGLPYQQFYRFNVDGTEHVLAACKHANVHRLVFVSTESVLVDFTDHAGDEASVPYPPRYHDGYSETKAAAERAVLAAHEAGGVSAAIVRPCWVWGPGDLSILPALLRLAKPGLFTWVGGSRKQTTTSHVENVVHGLILAAERAEAAGEIFFIGDDEAIAARELVTQLLATCGIERGWPSVPFSLGMLSARLFEGVHGLLRLGGQPALSRYGVALLGCEQRYSIEKAKRLLGYTPVVSIADGMAGLRTWVEEVGGADGVLRLAGS